MRLEGAFSPEFGLLRAVNTGRRVTRGDLRMEAHKDSLARI
jgi:hypothetical protein